ncbi:hypothetical protein LPJ78_004960 [Coemansia sp. RSA 989]|nr:isochorismatase hydrolase [Coemansia mojavensis]KAJ1862064.1 hypothetical protein LPJ78_004960 [Coemansia sp. RSA 989]KAJ1869978.1 hypothetical protein LPJ55_004997 [Coemansia sp. RSA 990]KAJ2628070.1 hypothetical protein H4R22_004084 [Coemansia sp. RSA 1290]KAJ2646372.1 hypothetical protein IWW40_005469 [Coemansia sp. RSA 1250]KAJ2667969.1 hypothetical protein IWW42_005565 [Coemansia sp. RSA 1085]
MSSPKRALIVIDAQNEYIDGGFRIEYPDVKISLPNIAQAMEVAKELNIPIIAVRHMCPPDFPIFAKGSRNAELHPDVKSRHYDHLIDKELPSCFTNTDLESLLKAHDVDTLTVVGYMTHNCNASTIYEARHRGYNVETLSDASGSLPYKNKAGSASAEEIHRVYTTVFHTFFASVVTTQEWIDGVRQNKTFPLSNYLESNMAALNG